MVCASAEAGEIEVWAGEVVGSVVIQGNSVVRALH